jgi:RNA polymerase sigma factor (sigma-70 family)
VSPSPHPPGRHGPQRRPGPAGPPDVADGVGATGRGRPAGPPDWSLVRQLAPEVLGALVRRYGHFDACEDAVQEALLAAARQWPVEGWPASPKGWLITVASRRLTDELRREEARRRREEADWARRPPPPPPSSAPPPPTPPSTSSPPLLPAGDTVHLDDEGEPGEVRLTGGRGDRGDGGDGPVGDDTLTLLFLCCHPALSPASQVALTLRAVGGLTTAEIARAFLVPEATMAQRISRAKERIRSAGARFRLPPPPQQRTRLRVVQQVLYLVFNEGYTATSGTNLVRDELVAEAIRLARLLLRLVPDDGETAGLLALMLLTDARRAARTTAEGALVPLAEQDRSRWDTGEIAEGVALVTGALRSKPLGPYQVQAAIAAVHDEAPSAEDTDWPQILALYRVLERLDPSPVVTLNRAVAVAMVDGPAAGLAVVDALAGDARVARSHHFESVRGHLLELTGDRDGARSAYQAAAQRARSLPEQRHLRTRAARLRGPGEGEGRSDAPPGGGDG